MSNILVFGAGQIGTVVRKLLAAEGHNVTLIDNRPEPGVVTLNVLDYDKTKEYIQQHPVDALVSCLPYYRTYAVAKHAEEQHIPYFDLTEDVEITAQIKRMSEGSSAPFVPQCGLAPGFIGILANDLVNQFRYVKNVRLRVGALPVNSTNALNYSLTWSIDGLLNEYTHGCNIIENGVQKVRPGLEDKERLILDGVEYEAFNTSGGLGNLFDLYKGKVSGDLNYKTIRYPGHCDKMKFLLNDLNLRHDIDTLKNLLINALPTTLNDVVLVYVSVEGFIDDVLVEKQAKYKIYANDTCSAIQLTTAGSLCAVVDIVLNNLDKYKGFVSQETITLAEFMSTPYSKYFRQ